MELFLSRSDEDLIPGEEIIKWMVAVITIIT